MPMLFKLFNPIPVMIKNFIVIFAIFNPFLVIADDVVIEVLVSSKDNDFWRPKKNLHLTLAHIKNVSGADIQKTTHLFNKEQKKLLNNLILSGFTVKNFNTNGFNAGHHILEADEKSFERLTKLNDILYVILNNKHGVQFTDKTTPQRIYEAKNPAPNTFGYTPHIEFLESNQELIPPTGTKIHFTDDQLTVRIVNFDRGHN